MEKGSSPLRHGIRRKGLFSGQPLLVELLSKGNTVSLRESVSSPIALHRPNEIHSSAMPATSWTHHVVYQGEVDSGSSYKKEATLI